MKVHATAGGSELTPRNVAIAALALSLALSPVALASWMAYGGYEPSSIYDDSSVMWQDAATGRGRVYFDVITFEGFPPTQNAAFVDPNVGALGMRMEAASDERHEGVLGEWIDCNNDGYIGLAESALREYSAKLLLNASICPPATGSTGTWNGFSHNYNDWVSELIPIGRGRTLNDARVYRDDEAMVWGDHGAPDAASSHLTCPFGRLPRGAASTTGGILDVINCYTRTETVNLLDTWDRATNATGLTELGFTDPTDAESGPLGTIPTLGPEDSSKSPVRVWDCGGFLVNEGPVRVRAIALSPQDVSDPSVAGFVNETHEGITPISAPLNLVTPGDDCDPRDDNGHDTYGLVENAATAFDPADKRSADWNFDYAAQTRGTAQASLLGPGNAGMDSNFGIDIGSGVGGSHWVAPATTTPKLGFGIFTRDELTVAPADAYWLTFYAHIGAATYSRGLSGPGTTAGYGSAQCGSLTTGVHAGWNCDGSLWYLNADGTQQHSTFPYAKPGQKYELRDSDCYDGGNNEGLPLQPAGFSTHSCP